MNVLPPHGVVEWLLTGGNMLSVVGVLVGLSIILLSASSLIRARNAAPATATGSERRRKQMESLASRWQLILLGTTGFVLSLASGYTT
jgi:hypothetical protein